MISEQKKQEPVSQISHLSNEQAEALEEYILALSDTQSGQKGVERNIRFLCVGSRHGKTRSCSPLIGRKSFYRRKRVGVFTDISLEIGNIEKEEKVQ